MRICFVSRRYWPAVSGMSVYAENLLRELVALGHDVTLVSQYRDDEAGTRVYGGGPPPADRVPAGVEVHALPSRGETVVPADWEGDIEELVRTVVDLPAVLAALRTAGYDRLVTLELSRDGHRAHQMVPRSIELLKEAEA